jgi:hypothetical protein
MISSKLKTYIYRQKPVIDIYKKFLFFPNAKVAKRSIVYSAINNRAIIKSNGCRHNYRVSFRTISTHEIEKMFKFTFVRNPWARAVSAFFYLQQCVPKPRYQGNRADQIKCSGELIQPQQTFKQFVKEKFITDGINTNPHFHFQYPNIYYKNKIFVDYIGRLENINDDWRYVASKINVSDQLPHKNESKHDHYTEYYDNETKDIITNIYKKDIELLGYTYGE